MSEFHARAITAIRDREQEALIAGWLISLGWEVIYRATNLESLKRVALENPETLIIASSDFREILAMEGAQVLLLQGSEDSYSGGKFPSDMQELHQLLRATKEVAPIRASTLQKMESNLHLITSVGRGVGCTNVAINLAAELALNEKRVLLVDANFAHPSIAEHFKVNRIRGQIHHLQWGFSIGEISNLEMAERVYAASQNYSHLIIDFGQYQLAEWPHVERRSSEEIKNWLIRSSNRLTFVTTDKEERYLDLQRARTSLAIINSSFAFDHLITPRRPLSRRERGVISQAAELVTGQTPTILTFDRRAIESAELKEATIAHSSPKSLLRGDISRWSLDIYRVK